MSAPEPTTADLQQIADLLRLQGQAIDALARRVPAQPCPILTRPEAIRYVRTDSDSAFSRWCVRWHVRPCSQGRYARRQLDAALQREALGTRRRPTATAKPAKSTAAIAA